MVLDPRQQISAGRTDRRTDGRTGPECHAVLPSLTPEREHAIDFSIAFMFYYTHTGHMHAGVCLCAEQEDSVTVPCC